MSKRIPSLDGLRAVSIVMVMIDHAINTNGFPVGLPKWLLLVFDGETGVRVFFVISGFLITHLLLKEEQQHKFSIQQFYFRRALRILPVYWTSIFIVFIYDLSAHLNLSSWVYLHALTFTTGLSPNGHWLLAQTWSLSVEETFYLFWPLLIACLGIKRRFYTAAAIIVICPALRMWFYKFGPEYLFERSFFTHADAIMMGALGALAVKFAPARIRELAATSVSPLRLLALALILTALYAKEVGRLNWLTVPFGPTLQSLAILYLVISLTTIATGKLFAFLNHPLAVKLGTLSYGLYLWQQIFLYPAKNGSSWWQMFPVNLMIALMVAVVSYHCIERPFLSLKDRINRRKNEPTSE